MHAARGWVEEYQHGGAKEEKVVEALEYGVYRDETIPERQQNRCE